MADGPPGWGEPAPFFTAVTDGVSNYSIQVAAGRWMVLMVFGSLGTPACAEALERVMQRRALFDDVDALFFGVTIDPADRLDRGLCNSEPGIRFFWDLDRTVSQTLGVIDTAYLHPTVFLIDRQFRIAATAPIEAVDAVLDQLAAARQAEDATAAVAFPPILIAPRIFEPEFCRTLLDYFASQTAEESGFAIDVDGRTETHVAAHLKRREDVGITDATLLDGVMQRLEGRLLPLIQRSFAWRPTDIERFLICRYAAGNQGFFSAHRDNVTAGTAHRKFAVSINLNAEGYEGGDIRFPEFSRQTFRPPTGGAAVFACGLLHEVTPVTVGQRFTLVPFLYDADGARVRAANAGRVDGEVAAGRRFAAP
jgi:peroxiredoxin/predicted 2-oxoglutarate/Fe(II)-dependent dioxygenase YbiX